MNYILNAEFITRINSYLVKTIKTDMDTIALPKVAEAFNLGDNNNFRVDLSRAIKDGKFPGFELRRGRYGGIGKDRMKKVISAPVKNTPAPVVPAPPVVKLPEPVKPTEEPMPVEMAPEPIIERRALAPAPLPKIDYPKPPTEKTTLLVGDKRLEIPTSSTRVKLMLEKVFNCKEDSEGTIVLDGYHYATEDTKVVEYIDNFVFYLMAGQTVYKGELPPYGKKI